jgi:hypothetical protein
MTNLEGRRFEIDSRKPLDFRARRKPCGLSEVRGILAFIGALAFIGTPVLQFLIRPVYAENDLRNVLGENEPVQRLFRFQRHRSSNCPDRGTEFGWRESGVTPESGRF